MGKTKFGAYFFTRVAILICILLVFSISLSGCYDNTEIDKLAHVIAIGIDNGNKEQLRITMQFAAPTGGGGEEGGDNASLDKKAFYQTTVNAHNIYDAINVISTYLSKKIQFAHTEILVISEELASTGVSDIMETIAKNNVFRPNMYIAISKGSAEDYLKNITPVLESNPAKYYKLFHKAYEFSGVTSDTRLLPFMLRQQCTCTQAVAAVVNFFEGEKVNKDKERRSEIKGLAVFREDKMVGSLNERETMYYLLVNGIFRRAKITFPYDENKGQYVVIDLNQNNMPQINVSINNLNIDIHLELEGELIALENIDISDEEIDIIKIENVVSGYLEDEITNFLKKTAVTFNSDICSIGKAAKGQFLTWDEWIRYNWHSKYKDANFNLQVKIEILSNSKK